MKNQSFAKERPSVFVSTGVHRWRWFFRIRTAFAEFLGLPVVLAFGLILLGALLYALELAASHWIQPVRAGIMRFFFQTSESPLSGGPTTASIIITRLLLVLQQTAGNMGNMIYDQFLQRRTNQIFVGLVITLVFLNGRCADPGAAGDEAHCGRLPLFTHRPKRFKI